MSIRIILPIDQSLFFEKLISRLEEVYHVYFEVYITTSKMSLIAVYLAIFSRLIISMNVRIFTSASCQLGGTFTMTLWRGDHG